MIIDGEKVELVSAHGAHSGQFCSHAEDALEEIVQEYIRQGFSWIGITEHIPPVYDHFLFPFDYREGGSARDSQARFCEYISLCRELQFKYRKDIRIFVGFETDAWSGYQDHVGLLVERHRPDYYVGSVHVVADVFFESGKDNYWKLVEQLGGIEELYKSYFDLQYQMIAAIKPAVVGHFDVIRRKDPDSQATMQKQEVIARIRRNLLLIKQLGLALDLNVSQYRKGDSEPCPGQAVLREAIRLGVKIVPGDDAHSVSQVGSGMEEGLRLLKRLGGTLKWSWPVSDGETSCELMTA